MHYENPLLIKELDEIKRENKFSSGSDSNDIKKSMKQSEKTDEDQILNTEIYGKIIQSEKELNFINRT